MVSKGPDGLARCCSETLGHFATFQGGPGTGMRTSLHLQDLGPCFWQNLFF